MGYQRSYLVTSQMGYTVAQLLDSGYNGFTELNVSGPSYYTSYNYFQYLEKLNEKHKHVDWNYPLIGCYRLANCYFNQNKTSPVTHAMEKIETEFEKLRGYWKDDYSTLKQNIHTFLSKVTIFTPTPALHPLPPTLSPSSPTTSSSLSPSSAGPVAGTLTTFGLGGAAAAYVFNLGGAKTFVNGLLTIG
ncbi:mitogen-activated protein kinase kinase kinase 13-B-like [Babesia caballi]|uniref:Mitogen-activated protein kinase kinase kinase 13-B-like n=1 Tax=Babesia caballi TaxID=5871 RepID=A0AAV4LZJ3_BABCB|nr:mitogen-activated protein kinase kinase kinase 13-B-like [Babesia caballi]